MVATDIANDRFSNLDFMMKNDWLSPRNPEKSKIYAAIAHVEGYTPMPPADKPQFFGTEEGRRLNEILARWIQALPQADIETTYTKWNLKDKRNIRQKPGTDGAVCGQFQAGDIVYGDNREKNMITSGGIKWMLVFLQPSHSRLTKGACPAPEDGVYWIAQ